MAAAGKSSKIGLQPAVDHYLDVLRVERGLAKNTLAAYGRDLAGFIDFCARYDADAVADVGQLTSRHVLSYAVHLGRRRLALRSQSRMLIAVRGLGRFLRAEHLTELDPAAEVELPRAGRPLPKALSEAEVEALLAAPDPSTPRGCRDAAMIELL